MGPLLGTKSSFLFNFNELRRLAIALADRGRNGGFQLLEGYRTELTESETEAMFLAGLPGAAEQLGLADILSTAWLKLTAALPAHVQPRAQRIAARFHLDPAALREQMAATAKRIAKAHRPARETSNRTLP